MQPVRIVMLGTGDFALPTFERLCGVSESALSGSERQGSERQGPDRAAFAPGVVGLVTQPDRPQGRKQELIPSRIKQAALEREVPVYQPEDVNSIDSLEFLRDWRPDLLVTAAYGQILSAELLGLPPLGGINLHGSILPAYRGAAPVARAIQNGEPESGVTVIRMTPRIDAGGIIAIARTPIEPDETAGALEARLAELGAPLIEQAIGEVASGTATVLPQRKSKVTRAPKLRKEDGQIDWSKPAQAVHNLVRAMQPWPTAFTTWHPREVGKDPLRLIVHRTEPVAGQGEPGHVVEAEGDRLVVAAGQGAVRIVTVQLPGKRAMAVAEFLRGHHAWPGDRMGE